VIWVAVGGRGTLVGAALGAVLVNWGKTYFTGALPEYWLFALGLLFILVTLFLPQGIVGVISRRRTIPGKDVEEGKVDSADVPAPAR
jgi:urea transport system permease protein